jgi:DNA adenine methylase
LIKSCLQWAGGKSRILDRLYYHFPQECNQYLEPFIGSGVVLFNAPYTHKIGMDINPDVTDLFALVKISPDSIIEECKELFHNGKDKDIFL